MSRLIFKAADVRRVVEHSLAAPEQGKHTIGYDSETNEMVTAAVEAPAVVLAHDDGVYLMSNGRPRDILDGDSAYVAYAKGCNPHTDADFYDTARALVGGDDFGETLPWAQRMKEHLDVGATEIIIIVGKNSLELFEPPWRVRAGRRA